MPIPSIKVQTDTLPRFFSSSWNDFLLCSIPTEGKAKMISLDDFNQLDLRIATITAAESHPNADRLIVLKIDLGSEERQLVAGIQGHYTSEELVGKQIVVLANLRPAKLRGIESQGMLLAVRDADNLVVIKPEKNVAPGTKVS
jgi:methionyl-tRNA synthetase